MLTLGSVRAAPGFPRFTRDTNINSDRVWPSRHTPSRLTAHRGRRAGALRSSWPTRRTLAKLHWNSFKLGSAIRRWESAGGVSRCPKRLYYVDTASGRYSISNRTARRSEGRALEAFLRWRHDEETATSAVSIARTCCWPPLFSKDHPSGESGSVPSLLRGCWRLTVKTDPRPRLAGSVA